MSFFSSVFSGREQRRNNQTSRNGRGGPFPDSFNIFDVANHAFEATAGVAANLEEQQEPRGPPPASRRAIRQLPTVMVTSEDLVDENNRECCICFEEHKIGDKVTRLPCAHIYHPHCITEWLSKHCTCPVCRYELPTDDPSYERGRKERMSRRKPRYARYELERLSMKELRELCNRLKIDLGMEKSEVIRQIMESGKIDVIVAPDPVEYENLDVLRAMGVGKLKKAMAEAGVFFDARDVVEKEDMVQIFFNSGRIILLNPEIENVDENVYGYASESLKPDLKHENEEKGETKRPRTYSAEMELSKGDSVDDSDDDSDDAVEDENMSLVGEEEIIVEEILSQERTEEGNNLEAASARTTYNGPTTRNTGDRSMSSQITDRSVKELRSLARMLDVNISDCIEKQEMVDRIVAYVCHSTGTPNIP